MRRRRSSEKNAPLHTPQEGYPSFVDSAEGHVFLFETLTLKLGWVSLGGKLARYPAGDFFFFPERDELLWYSIELVPTCEKEVSELGLEK